MDFLIVAIVVPSFLIRILVDVLRRTLKQAKRKRLQRENLNPLGAFIFDPSGKPIS
jgi:hypothetical protein